MLSPLQEKIQNQKVLVEKLQEEQLKNYWENFPTETMEKISQRIPLERIMHIQICILIPNLSYGLGVIGTWKGHFLFLEIQRELQMYNGQF